MSRRTRRKGFVNTENARDFLNHLVAQRRSLMLFAPLILVFWVIERWVIPFSNWVPLVVAVWATLQYGNYQRGVLQEDLNKKWKRILLSSSTTTPLEQCQWLNKLLSEIWPNCMNRKLSMRFASLVEKRLRQRRSRLIEKIQLLEFSLGSCPPSLGLHGTCWLNSGDQKIMRLDFEWDTTDLSILLEAKLAKPFNRTARIVVNSLHIKGDILIRPILDGRALLYSFVSNPEVRIGVAFGSGGSQSLPATELPGVSSWLVKIFTETLNKRMVEPRRGCFPLPATELHKRAVGGIIYVTVVSGNKIYRNAPKGSPPRSHQGSSSMHRSPEDYGDKAIETFVEVELEELARRTDIRAGPNPTWHSTFNMVLHDVTGTLRFNLFEFNSGSIKYDNLASCEVKVRYVGDDSTIFWAIGPDNGAIAKHAEFCGKEVEMVVPFEGVSTGELTIQLVLKEWQFSDGSHSLSNFHPSSSQLLNSSSNFPSRTGRKIMVTVLEGKDLVSKSGKCEAFVKLQYGKSIQRTKTVTTTQCIWNQKFEFEELTGGECLKVRCYSEEILSSDSIGSASVNLEGLVEGSVKDIWVPLEKVNSGELHLLIEVVKPDDSDKKAGSGNGMIELVLVEARDLVAADLRGTSDPYVRVQYGDKKRKTKVIYKTLSPRWNQIMEFPEDGSPLELYVKDYNAVLPTSSIGNCIVEYQRLPPNEMFDKWIPLQGVKRGEIRVCVTRKVPELLKRPSTDSESPLNKAQLISNQMKQVMIKFQSLIDDEDLEGLTEALGELESLEDEQEEYLIQLQMEQMLLINKIKELGQEILNSAPSPSRSPSPSASRRSTGD